MLAPMVTGVYADIGGRWALQSVWTHLTDAKKELARLAIVDPDRRYDLFDFRIYCRDGWTPQLDPTTVRF